MASSIFETTPPDDYLLRLAASDLGRGYRRLALAELRISPGHTVLDLGCGPGADLPDYAEATGGQGRVIGIDNDPRTAAQAGERTRALPQVHVELADVHRVPLADHSVDRIHTDRVLQHVADPSTVLAEARRLLRPGGRAVFAEPDWDTLIIDHPDVTIARAYTRFVSEQVVRNACIGRQLRRLAIQAGFAIEKIFPITALFADVVSADKVLGLQRTTERAVRAGYLTGQHAEALLQHLTTEPFFASATLFVASATAG